MASDYEALAEHYKNDVNIVVSEIDATSNDVKGVKIEGFPTLIFYKAYTESTSDFVEFNAERTTSDMIKFIDENRKSK